MTVVLIGPPAAGKSSAGRALARLRQERFTDTDEVIEAGHGPIPEIFARRGEAFFREVEREAVARALPSGGVVCLGGGAVLEPRTAAALQAHTVILLTVSAQAAAGRIGGGGRPLVHDLSSWQELVRRRMPVYRALADHTIDTSHLTVAEVARLMTHWIDEAGEPARKAEA